MCVRAQQDKSCTDVVWCQWLTAAEWCCERVYSERGLTMCVRAQQDKSCTDVVWCQWLTAAEWCCERVNSERGLTMCVWESSRASHVLTWCEAGDWQQLSDVDIGFCCHSTQRWTNATHQHQLIFTCLHLAPSTSSLALTPSINTPQS